MVDDEQYGQPSTVRRRDFLSGIGVAAFGLPLAARVAYAQTGSNQPPADTKIDKVAIYPPLGISRVGDSAKWFYAPEVPGVPALPLGNYKDGPQRIKKQVQRFRVYAFNRAGQVIREVTAADGRIDWTVEVANTKAAWYGFNNPLDNDALAPGLPSQKRNQAIVSGQDRAEMLVIHPKPVQISGTNMNAGGNDPAFALNGRFWRTIEVRLGHLQTDEAGRLAVFPGDGRSQSAVPNNPISNFSDNDGWCDDWADGPVRAKVTVAGVIYEAENGWIACCGPHFAPEIPPFISLFDVMTDVAVEVGWLRPAPGKLSFRKEIYPFFRRLGLMNWVTSAQNLHERWINVGNFADPAYVATLADPSETAKPLREKVFKAFRDPNDDAPQQYKLPYMLGDGINYQASPLRWFRIPTQQYDVLKKWAAGEFVDDMGPRPWRDEAPEFDKIPLSEQPEALTRAALEMCSGGAFHPGVELTWPLRHAQLYRGPYRIALSTDRNPDLIQDLGQLLTPDLAFKGVPPVPPAIAPQMPGDLTRWMGIPWQCDAFSCQQVVFANDFPNAAWWPALLPIDVLPEAYYYSVMDPKLTPEQRVKFFESRVAWSRGVAGIGYHAEASYTDGLNQMISLWNRMGFVVKRPAPPDRNTLPGVPENLFVEVDRGSMDLTLDTPPFSGPPRQ
jgi:hypothetical protein